MDTVALAAVISTGAVGLGSLFFTAVRFKFERQDKVMQRVHERALSHDERIRDDRVKLYVELLAEANRVSRDVRARYGVGTAHAPLTASDKPADEDALDLLAARVTAFASDSVRDSWFQFTEALRRFRTDPATVVSLVPAEAQAAAYDALGLAPVADPRDRLEVLYIAVSHGYETVCNSIRAELTRGA